MRTERIFVNRIKPGMVLAEDVYNNADQLVLGYGTVLNGHTITRLKFYNIREVVVEMQDAAPVETSRTSATAPQPSLQKEELSYTDKIKKSAAFIEFSEKYNASLNDLKEKMTSFLKHPGASLNTDELLSGVTDVLSSTASGGQVFDIMMCMRGLDDTTYVHGMNVAIICNIFADWLKLSPEDKKAVTLAGLFCDVGKLSVPKEILEKKGALTEAEYGVIKGHARAGFNMLKSLPIDKRIALAALQHHERIDGSGYPDGVRGEHISQFAKIVAIADVYDAMTAARSYRGAICPLEVLNGFEKDGLTKYDPSYLLTFMDKIVSTYINHHVQLNNGKVGEIIMINKHAPARPILRMHSGECIDLSKEKDLSIVGIV